MTSAKKQAARKPLDYYLGLQYPLHVHADPEGGYVVTFPDLPGCMTQGETLEEVAAMAEDARRGWIEVEYERGSDIPRPSYAVEYSGKFNVRIPKSLHRSLASAAEREGMSLNQYVVYLLGRGDAQARVERVLEEYRLVASIGGRPSKSGRHPLRGQPFTYVDPTEPAAEKDWEAAS